MTSRDGPDELRQLLHGAVALADDALAGELAHLVARLDEPLIVALAGKVKAGKSTLLNALVGEELAPTDAGECTRVVTWYRNGPTYRVQLQRTDGSERQLPFSRESGALEVDLAGTPIEQIERLVVDWPSARLADVTLVDTPGLDSVSQGTSDRTRRFLGGDQHRPGDADAVIYLMRHLHRTDMGFLEAFRDRSQALASPINTIAVLSRADEVGVCRLDAMSAAQRIARGWRSDPRIRRLCQTVVPVAGLLAQAGATLTEREYRALAALAALPRPQVDALLLTVDRFLHDEDCPVTQVEREDLIARLGVFGVRVSISLIRLGAAETSPVLAAELSARSGIADLRSLLLGVFAERRSILKSRVAMAALDAALDQIDDPRADGLRRELERIEASAHELVEIHLLNAVRAGLLSFRHQELEELEQLLSTIGAPVHERLGAPADADLREIVVERVVRWRSRAENPLSTLAEAQAAREVARAYEGLLSSR